jgi:ATP-dependent Clp protease ATP-binding subunit ClpA
MYERFTDRARKVMQLANQEAQRFNHEYIGTEHILLGLVKEGSGVAANVLKNLDINLPKVRREVEKLVLAGPDLPKPPRLPQTPRAKKVIEYSIEEARNLNHNYVGTEHLLLGLLREQEGVAAQVLMNLGLKLEGVREEVLNLLGPAEDVRRGPARKTALEKCAYRLGRCMPGYQDAFVFLGAFSATLAGGWFGVQCAGLDDPNTGGVVAGAAFLVAIVLTYGTASWRARHPGTPSR